MLIKKKIQRFHSFIEQKINKNNLKTFFQNIIATVFITPFTLIFCVFILAIKTEFINGKVIELLASIVSIILMFTIFGLYLMFVYISIYTKNGILFKIAKLTFLFLVFSYNIYLFIVKDIQNLNNFDNFFIMLTTVLTAYMLVKTIRNFISNVYNWIFDNNPESKERDELIKFKLSFIKSIIIGFITFVATLLGISLTIKQLFFT
ncbi:hypothetical protein ACSBQ3_09870 [Staphylococcus equorum]|uniref:hypothetical protein n=1 Tax=Staphylococcus equorum TaxID=246432 RepID=UPI000D1C316F|nr:hypothetical protein [Staphylococcus equorum]PTE28889.1 hypothetical protein BUY91_03075 [Staphylococcus equorum]